MRRRRTAGTVTYAGLYQMRTTCENYAQAHVRGGGGCVCACARVGSWVKATNCCTMWSLAQPSADYGGETEAKKNQKPSPEPGQSANAPQEHRSRP